MKWTIDKSFSFCYGHRVHNQILDDAEFTDRGNCDCVCRHLHGHEGLVKVFLEGDELVNGMVTDFKNIGWFKNFLDDNLDHKFIMDLEDPIIEHEFPLLNDALLNTDCTGFTTFDMDSVKECLNDSNMDEPVRQGLYEKYEGAVFVPFVPTSENLCTWLMTVANKKMKGLGIEVSSVEFWETPKSHCKVSQ